MLLADTGLERLADPALVVGRNGVAGVLDRLVELAERVLDAEPLPDVLDDEPGELKEDLETILSGNHYACAGNVEMLTIRFDAVGVEPRRL